MLSHTSPSSRVRGIVLIPLLVGLGTLVAVLSARVESAVHCYLSNDLRVCHDTDDEGVFYDTPSNMVAYAVQTVKLNSADYLTRFHSGPIGKSTCLTGDSVRGGVHSITHAAYYMPSSISTFLWGNTQDTASRVYSGDYLTPIGTRLGTKWGYPSTTEICAPWNAWNGAANPMTLFAATGSDTGMYTFFISTTADDNGHSDTSTFGHRLHMAYTISGSTYIRYGAGSTDWTDQSSCATTSTSSTCRPYTLVDGNSNPIISEAQRYSEETVGLIGSMNYVSAAGKYYFFYTDYDGSTPKLFYRTLNSSSDLSQNGPLWSAPTALMTVSAEMIVRVALGAPPHNDRWVVMYNCYRDTLYGTQDVCLQYTEPFSSGDPTAAIAALTVGIVDSNHYLGLAGGSVRDFQQPYWLTDKVGNLTNPSSSETRGGELRWTNFYRDGSTYAPYGGIVYRGGWDVYPCETSGGC